MLAVMALGLALASCSTFGGKKKQTQIAYQERPVEVLFNVGANALDHHLWNDAVAYFKEVERQHPYSEWSRRSILMEAYAHYQANAYGDAIADADRFISLYPGNVATKYAYYLKAICYFEQIVDVGRDQGDTENAEASLREVMRRYPGTEYAQDAKVKHDMVEDQLAGKEMTVGRFYLREGNPIAAIGRFHNVVNRYQTTSHAPEALYRLVEANLALGLVDEAKRNGAVLGFNYPGDIWYHDAYKLLTSKGLRLLVQPVEAKPRLPKVPRLLPFGKHKEITAAPPPVSPDPPK
jgi:outer membrane protein assembly factor BamD